MRERRKWEIENGERERKGLRESFDQKIGVEYC